MSRVRATSGTRTSRIAALVASGALGDEHTTPGTDAPVPVPTHGDMLDPTEAAS